MANITDTPGLRPHRACRNCVQIKAKCIPLQGDIANTDVSICQRCHRLGKTCSTPAPAPRKRHRKNATRVSQLEERIEQLTNLVTSSRVDVRPKSPTLSRIPTPPISNVHEDDGTPMELGTVLSSQYWTKISKLRSLNALNTYTNGRPDFQISAGLEDQLFTMFRTEMAPHFPFVVIPPTASTEEFRREHPFLFKTCVGAACHNDAGLQLRLGREMFKIVGEQMLLHSEKSLDLLQGLLVLCAWYQFYNHFHPQLMNLVQLSMALVIDLGLNRPCPDPQSRYRLTIDTVALLHGKATSPSAQTADDRRAVLGCYYLFGKLSNCFKRFDPFRWTQHLDQCCQALFDDAEYPSDNFLVQLVRLQRVVERYLPYALDHPSVSVPLISLIKCFEEDILAFRAGAVPTAAANGQIEMHILGAQIGLYEIAFLIDCEAPIHRIAAWDACLKCMDEFWDSFMEQSPEMLPGLTFFSWLHVVHVVLILAKLSFLVADGWDLDYVRAKWPFTSIIQRLIEKLLSISNLETGSASKPLTARFALYAERMISCQKWYDAKIKEENNAKESDMRPAHSEAAASGPNNSDGTFDDMFEAFETGLWQDFVYDWTSPLQ